MEGAGAGGVLYVAMGTIATLGGFGVLEQR